MRHAVLTLLLAVLAPAAFAGPAEAVAAAAADCRALPAAVQPYTRYLSLYAVPERRRAEFRKALSFHVNSLSREAVIVPPADAGPDLVRVNLLDYQWDAKVFDGLAAVDPYFHAVVQVEEEVEEEQEYGYFVDAAGSKYHDAGPGRTWKTTETKKVRVKKKTKKVNAAAPWLDPRQIADLIALTQSSAPVLRADWFIYQTGIERDGQTSYAELLGLGNQEKDFDALIGADENLSRKVRKEIAGVLARSGVAVNNRRVVRLQAITGPYWITDDFNTSVGKQNVLRFLDGDTDPPEGDASERYGVLPDGLFAYWLQNAKGVRQSVVPQAIALDGHTASNDRNIHLGIRNCASCHVEGIRPIADYARRTYRGAIQLQAADYGKFVHLRQLYLTDLDGQVRADNESFSAVLLAVNGLSPAKNAATYEAAWDAYAEDDVSPEAAAVELGTTPAQLQAALKAAARVQGQLDPVLAQLIDEPPAHPAILVRREHWEEIFGVAETLIRGYLP